MATGGSVINVSLNGQNFPVTADADTTRKLGGYENAVETNGDKSARILKTVVSPMFGGLVLSVDSKRKEQEVLQGLQNLDDFFPVAVTYADGVVYQGRGAITGEVAYQSASTTTPIDITGEGTFTQQ